MQTQKCIHPNCDRDVEVPVEKNVQGAQVICDVCGTIFEVQVIEAEENGA